MGFDVKSYLADIDREIAHNHQLIAELRLKNAELEEMRLTMMRREEYRSAVHGQPSPFGALHGAEIAVRRIAEDGALSHAAKTGEPLPLPGPATPPNVLTGITKPWPPKERRKKSWKRSPTFSHKNMRGGTNTIRAKILLALEGEEEGLTTAEICRHLGAFGDEAMKPIRGALNNMRHTGIVQMLGGGGKGKRQPNVITPKGLKQLGLLKGRQAAQSVMQAAAPNGAMHP